MKLKAEV